MPSHSQCNPPNLSTSLNPKHNPQNCPLLSNPTATTQAKATAVSCLEDKAASQQASLTPTSLCCTARHLVMLGVKTPKAQRDMALATLPALAHVTVAL